MRVIELFAGVGSQTQALKNIGIDHKVVGIAEIDKYAISSYMQLHGETPLLGDITKIESLPDADLWTYSFPCQDISVAGKGLGIKEGTRSGLLSHVERLLESSDKPKYLLMENVKNLIGKKHKPDFDIWCKKLEELGYKNFYQVLNAKDYGVPQNRERVFMVSLLQENEYMFPQKEELNIRLKDILETKVDKSYYLAQKYLDRYKECPTLKNYKEERIKTQVGSINDSKNGWGNPQHTRIYSETGICATLTLCAGTHGYSQGYIEVPEATKKGYNEATIGDSINLEQPNSKTRRGRVGKGQANTLTTSCSQAVVENNFKIRKLTPRECWRLMGWKDEQFDKIQGISNTQLYKQAGNGIVVDVLEAIFRNLFKGE
ncbi:MAG: DNA cytosine methyltransferase [Fusobacteriaceae bacterium]